MKTFLTSFLAAFALVLAAQADDMPAKITGLHICCGSCAKSIQSTVDGVPGLKATIDKDAGTVTLTAADKATLQKGADALTSAGFFGMSTDVTIDASTGAKGQKMQTLTINNAHVCCPKCVKAIGAALKDVPGVTGNTAAKGATTFTVTGDFNDKDVFDALQKIGLTGREGP
jgi:copper chaperone CopZ